MRRSASDANGRSKVTFTALQRTVQPHLHKSPRAAHLRFQTSHSAINVDAKRAPSSHSAIFSMSPPQVALSGLHDLSADDQTLFVQYGVGELLPAPFACVHHAFKQRATDTPTAIAVEHLSSSITYSELDRLSDGLATELRTLGVVPGARVCLLVQRSIPMIVGILAVLKAGGQYVPLDGGIVTDSTLGFVLDDSRASVVLALRDYSHRVPTSSIREVIILEDAIAKLTSLPEPLIGPSDLSSPDDGVYVIYTSGL